MNGLAFFDTNIFLYIDDASSPRKREVALTLVRQFQSEGRLLVSLQVLQEYLAIATRKYGIPAELAQRKVEVMRRMRVVPMDAAELIAAIELHRLHQVSCWDASIVHAARVGGATVLYSEDLQHLRTWTGIGGNPLTVINPFAEEG